MRVKHYVKNVLIFVPLLFSKNIFHTKSLLAAVLGFVCFSLLSSVIYIFNDIQDAEHDRNHPLKKNRPIASGAVSKPVAWILLGVCLATVLGISLTVLDKWGLIYLGVYFGLNLGYSLGLKNYPIVDVVILSSGFVLRVLYGGVLTGIEISKWLYLVIITGALYMGLGKRRNEMKHHKDSRQVLQFYTESFLDKNMHVAMALVIAFYALWTVDAASNAMIWTVPLVMVILMRYSYNIEGDANADPVEVLLRDKVLILLAAVYALCVFALLYLF